MLRYFGSGHSCRLSHRSRVVNSSTVQAPSLSPKVSASSFLRLGGARMDEGVGISTSTAVHVGLFTLLDSRRIC